MLEDFCRSKTAETLVSKVSLSVGEGSTPHQIEMGAHAHGFITLKPYRDWNPWSNIMACLWHLSENNVTFQVEIQRNGSSVITTEMTMKKTLPSSPIPTECEDAQIRIPLNWVLGACESSIIFTTITATIPDEVLDGTLKKESALLHFKNVFENAILSDVLIVANDGTAFKAHKVVLASRSDVFEAMFQAKMKETREARVELPDLCGENLDAFLRYLYYEERVKEGNIEQILELYQAAHKYYVESLEKELLETMLSKPMNWFELDGTVKLFAFTRNLVPVCTDLQEKILRVLKTSASQIMDCPAYQELFRTNPVAGMHLCQMALMSK